MSKTTLTFKKDANHSTLKMKKITDKLNELTNPLDRKKAGNTRLKTQKE